MLEVSCRRHGVILRTSSVAFASKRCYFLVVGDKPCGRATALKVVD